LVPHTLEKGKNSNNQSVKNSQSKGEIRN